MAVPGMTRAVAPPRRFHRSRLIRVLEDLAVVTVADSRQPLGERLGQWLDFKDAISLYSVLHGGPSGDAGRRATAVAGLDLKHEVARVRAELLDGILSDIQLDPNETSASEALGTQGRIEFTPYNRSYLSHQRSMQTAVNGLRAQLRAVASTRSPALRQLAALDGELEKALGARERGLLAALPVFLGKRFEQLFAQGAEAGDDPASRAWLPGFCREMQAVLCAELDLRLQPVFGLLDALGTDGAGQ